MLRGIFMPADVSQDAVDYYIDLFTQVRETPEWKDFMAKGAFNTTFMTGDEFRSWVAKAAATHEDLMTKAGFVAKRSEEHTSELQSLMRISYAVFCLKKKQKIKHTNSRQ